MTASLCACTVCCTNKQPNYTTLVSVSKEMYNLDGTGANGCKGAIWANLVKLNELNFSFQLYNDNLAYTTYHTSECDDACEMCAFDLRVE